MDVPWDSPSQGDEICPRPWGERPGLDAGAGAYLVLGDGLGNFIDPPSLSLSVFVIAQLTTLAIAHLNTESATCQEAAISTAHIPRCEVGDDQDAC